MAADAKVDACPATPPAPPAYCAGGPTVGTFPSVTPVVTAQAVPAPGFVEEFEESDDAF